MKTLLKNDSQLKKEKYDSLFELKLIAKFNIYLRSVRKPDRISENSESWIFVREENIKFKDIITLKILWLSKIFVSLWNQNFFPQLIEIAKCSNVK